jgi:hypothetical protein
MGYTMEFNRDKNWSRFISIKNDIILNASYIKLVINNTDKLDLKSYKLKDKRQWLRRLY